MVFAELKITKIIEVYTPCDSLENCCLGIPQVTIEVSVEKIIDDENICKEEEKNTKKTIEQVYVENIDDTTIEKIMTRLEEMEKKTIEQAVEEFFSKEKKLIAELHRCNHHNQ